MEFVIGKTVNYKHSDAPYGRGAAGKTARVGKGDRVVVGISSVFGNKDADGDIVSPEAFRMPVLQFKAGRSRCRFLWNHNSSEPPIAEILDLKILRKDELPATLRNEPDVSGGLQVTRKYFTDAYSDRVYQAVASGAVKEMSFAFDIVASHYDTVRGEKIRVLDEVNLFDCADVNWGSNPATMAAVKGPTVLNAAKIDRLKQQKARQDKLQELRAERDYLDPLARARQFLSKQSRPVGADAEAALLLAGCKLTLARCRLMTLENIGGNV